MDTLHWFKSSFSNGNGDSCVEIAHLPHGVALRDTKDRSLVPHRYTAAGWSDFLAGVRAGTFDRTA